MLDQLETILKDQLVDVEIERIEKCNPGGFKITPRSIKEICLLLQSHPDCYFDHLASLSGVDNGPNANTMEVIYTLYSIPHNQYLTLKVVLDREDPEVESVVDIWKAADWHEREAYDLLGIRFTGHPDLRRILLPADWVGYPLRKDYEESESYHGMKIKHPDALKKE